jgi:acyl carrier protein
MSPDPADLVARALDIQGAVSLDDDMQSLAAWTSLTHVKLIMEIEAALGRELTADEVGSVDSVRAVAQLLQPDTATA